MVDEARCLNDRPGSPAGMFIQNLSFKKFNEKNEGQNSAQKKLYHLTRILGNIFGQNDTDLE